MLKSFVAGHRGQIKQGVDIDVGWQNRSQGIFRLRIEDGHFERSQIVGGIRFLIAGIGDDRDPSAADFKIAQEGKGFDEIAVVDHRIRHDQTGLFHGGLGNLVLTGDAGRMGFGSPPAFGGAAGLVDDDRFAHAGGDVEELAAAPGFEPFNITSDDVDGWVPIEISDQIAGIDVELIPVADDDTG